MSPFTALSSLWRQWRPRVDPLIGVHALRDALNDGANLGEALKLAAPMLAQAAVSDAAMRFEGGAVALFIVEVRDSLRAQLVEAGTQVQDAAMLGALRAASNNVDGDTFVQHLINTLLGATDCYVESQLISTIDEARCTGALTALFSKSLCVVLTRSDAARKLGSRTRRLEFIPMPQPSSPR